MVVQKTVLQKSEATNGQRWCVVSLIGPTLRQKHEVYGIKVYCATEDRESADVFAELVREREKYFDVYVMDANAWVPLDVSPEDIKDQRFAEEMLNELLQKRRETHEQTEREFATTVSERKDGVKFELTPAGQEALSSQKESPFAVYFKIKQYKDLISKRTEEVEDLERFFAEQYTEEERELARNTQMPVPEPGPMKFQTLEAPTGDSFPNQ